MGDFESGRTSPSFGTVLAAAAALSAATKTEVRLADLVESPDFVTITDKLDPAGGVLANILRGDRTWGSLRRREVLYYASKRVDLQPFVEWTKKLAEESNRYPEYDDIATADLLPLIERQGLDEHRLAKRLDITDMLLAIASWRLWRRSFSEERDRRAGNEANAQKRGRVSRALQAELRKELARGNDQ